MVRLDQAPGLGPAFGRIAVQQAGVRPPLQHVRQFPAEVEGILHGDVHALTGLGAVGVAGITGRENARITFSCRTLRHVIEAVGHYHLPEGQEAPLAQAVQMIRNGGRVVTTGLSEQLSAVHFKTLVLKEANIISSRVTCGEFPRAIQMMGRGLLHPDLLITDVSPLDDIRAAFAQVDREDPETIKIVLEI